MFKTILAKVVEGETLTTEEARQTMDIMMDGEATPSQMASLLSILRFRGETIEEMTGFVQSMRAHVIPLEHGMDVMDTCGTGGDGASTFNISTATAIVLASLGVKVAKHGNRAASSKSGSADVLEYLDIPIQSNAGEALQALKEKNMCFLYAPLYHISMKHAGQIRKEIGFRTLFNLIGPLTNPAGSRRQLLGVFDTHLAEKMANTLKELESERAVFVTGGDGLDECSITTYTDLVVLDHGKITRDVITPESIGLVSGNLKDIQVSSVKESAEMILAILSGKANESATNILLLNAGTGLFAAGETETIAQGVHHAKQAIKSGQAYEHLLLLQDKGKVENHA